MLGHGAFLRDAVEGGNAKRRGGKRAFLPHENGGGVEAEGRDGGGSSNRFTPIPGFAGTSPVNGGRGSMPQIQRAFSSPRLRGGVDPGLDPGETEGALSARAGSVSETV